MSPTNFFAFKLIVGLHVRVDLWDVTVLKFPYSAKSLIKNSGQILQHSALFGISQDAEKKLACILNGF